MKFKVQNMREEVNIFSPHTSSSNVIRMEKMWVEQNRGIMVGAGQCKEEKSGEVRNSCDVFSV